MSLLVVDRKRQEAAVAARSLVDRVPGIEAVLVFGSVSRGDAIVTSDIDLMAVSREPVRGRTLRANLPHSSPISLVCHTWDSLRRTRENDWSFFVHLREEGDILHDSGSRLAAELGAVRQPSRSAVRESLRDEQRTLERFDDLRRFGSGYLFPLARVFRVGRFACMLDNTAHGRLAFKRDDAFDVFAARHPSVASDAARIQGLWPFLARTQGRRLAMPGDPESARYFTEALVSTRRALRAAVDA